MDVTGQKQAALCISAAGVHWFQTLSSTDGRPSGSDPGKHGALLGLLGKLGGTCRMRTWKVRIRMTLITSAYMALKCCRIPLGGSCLRPPAAESRVGMT